MSAVSHLWRADIGRTLTLAWPLVLGQLAGVLMTFVDTVMAGRLSAEALASVAAGAAMWHTIMLAGMGVLLAVSPSVAHLEGAGERERIGPLVRQALWIAAALSLLTGLVYLVAGPLLRALEIDPALHATVLGYLGALLWGAPAMYAFLTLRFLCEGMEISRPVMYFGFIGLAVNVVANYSLIYGHFGMPRLGAVGCGYATSAVWWVQFIGLVIYVRRHPRLRTLGIFSGFDWPQAWQLRALTRLGLPIGFSFFVEVSMFAGVALLMGSISAIAVAAHQIAINIASTTFMVPLGISLAATVRVGNARGRGDLEGARRAGWVGIGLALAVQVLSAVVLVTIPDLIAGIYTTDEAVLAIAVQLLFMAAIFQLSDGLQVSAAGALRGLKDTRGPMVVTVVSYWLIGLPFGYWLCFHRGLGPKGLWIGIIGGLTVAGAMLTLRFARLSRAPLSAAALTLLLLGGLVGCAGDQRPAERPNLLLVTIETLRADHVSAYGYERPTTPFLESLAAESYLFETAYASSSWTLPSLTSLLSSTYTTEHGVGSRGSTADPRQVIPDHLTLLPEVLSAEGYATYGLAATLQTKEEKGFHRGFGRFESLGTVGCRRVIDRFDEWLPDLEADDPWFLWLHLFDPHGPYNPREPWLTEFWPEGNPRFPEIATAMPQELYPRRDELTREQLDFMLALYDSEIRHADSCLAEIYAALPDQERLLVAVTSDHGEEFMERGRLLHAQTLYEESVRIPLVIRPVGGVEGQRIERPVSLVDVGPTLLAALGVENPTTFRGRDLLQESAEGARREPILSELLTRADQRVITDGRWKLMRVGGANRLYDVVNDPEERHDVAKQHPDIVAGLAAQLDDFARVNTARARAGREVANAPEDIEALRALGYVD